MAKKPLGRYRRAFFTGLATLLPTILTIFVLYICWDFITSKIAVPINSVTKVILKTEPAREYYWKGLWRLQDFQLDEVENNPPDPAMASLPDPPFSRRVDAHVPFPFGLVLALVLVFGVGFVFRGYIGRQIFRGLERLIQRVPVIKIIYPYAKQVTEFFFQEKKQITYDASVAVEYPRKGIWSVGFVTNEGFREVMEATGEEVVSIFIPSSPTPVTGYTILVPKRDVIQLSMSVDETLRFTISAGVILPPTQLPPLSLKTRKLDPPPTSD